MKTNYSQTIKITLTILVIIISAFFLFFRLGHYALWDDEAICALFGKSLWQNGDTVAQIDHNIIAFNWGRELKNLRMRYIPPLQFYIVSPWAGLTEGSTFWVRFPFALIGLSSICFLLFWMWKSNVSLKRFSLFSLGILGNASLFLYFRHCRYYAPAIFLTLILGYLYWHRNNKKPFIFSCILTGILLFATNYLCFLSASICILADYLLWGRKEKPIQLKNLFLIVLPILVFGGLILLEYYPLNMDVWDIETKNLALFKITLFFWNLRDLNACEMGVGTLILLAPCIFLSHKNPKFLRGTLTIFLYCLITAIFSPQPDGGLQVANVRYLAPLIPLCIFISVITIEHLGQKKQWIIPVLALLAFGTNILHGGPFVGVDKTTNFSKILPDAHVKSSIIDFTKELLYPHTSAFRKASHWINTHIEDEQSVWVLPTYINYPLIFHAPHATYAWQLLDKKGQFENLPEIHFFNKTKPDYIMVFGPIIKIAKEKIQDFETKNIYYKEIETIDVYWHDLIRAELFWHSFQEITNYSRKTQAIRIYKKMQKPNTL